MTRQRCVQPHGHESIYQRSRRERTRLTLRDTLQGALALILGFAATAGVLIALDAMMQAGVR